MLDYQINVERTNHMFGNKKRKLEKSFQKEQSKGVPLVAHHNPKSVHAEQFRTIRTNLEFVNLDANVSSIVVTSSIPAEGKSTFASNLAYVMAQTEKRVLIVDADMRKPMVHKTYNLSNETGVSTLISQSGVKVNEVIHFDEALNLYILPSGPIPPNPSELLASARMARLMTVLKEHFDVIIYDMPPLIAVTDAQIIGAKVDGVILVVRQGYVTREDVRNAKSALDNVNAKILGYVMNDKKSSDSAGYYTYYGYSEEE